MGVYFIEGLQARFRRRGLLQLQVQAAIPEGEVIKLIKRFPKIKAVHIIDPSPEDFLNIDSDLSKLAGGHPWPQVIGHFMGITGEIPTGYEGSMDIFFQQSAFDFDQEALDKAITKVRGWLKKGGVFVSAGLSSGQIYHSITAQEPEMPGGPLWYPVKTSNLYQGPSTSLSNQSIIFAQKISNEAMTSAEALTSMDDFYKKQGIRERRRQLTIAQTWIEPEDVPEHSWSEAVQRMMIIAKAVVKLGIRPTDPGALLAILKFYGEIHEDIGLLRQILESPGLTKRIIEMLETYTYVHGLTGDMVAKLEEELKSLPPKISNGI